MKKLFISFLGNASYKECVYYNEKLHGSFIPEKESVFVQEALIRCICKNWTQEDRIIIFTTENAFLKNWQPDNGTVGLFSILNGLKNQPEYSNLNISNKKIKDGKDEKELWEIFETVYSTINENDYITLDVTHAFRFIPMLTVVLLNYAKFLKNITVNNILYGNYEARKTNIAPIINLTGLSNLQDWTNGVNEFVRNGHSVQLKEIIEKEKNNISDKRQTYSTFGKHLMNFTMSISTVRGENIYSGKPIKELINSINQIKKRNELKVIIPILEKMSGKLAGFKTEYTKENGEFAIEWALEHNLIQQAYTMGQEHIISLLCDRYKQDYKDKKTRKTISTVLGSNKKKEKILDLKDIDQNLANIVFDDEIKDNIKVKYQNLTSIRNSMNHAGIISDDVHYSLFTKKFKENFDPIIKILKSNPKL